MIVTNCDLCGKQNATRYLGVPTDIRVMPELNVDVCLECKTILEDRCSYTTTRAFEVVVKALTHLLNHYKEHPVPVWGS
jgi:hypothetical protein